jgi:hypothetical protein
MTRQRSRERTRFSDVAQRISATAKAGALAVLSLGLFCSSPYTNEARAIDIGPTITNAALVFSLTQIFQGDPNITNVTQMALCARNLSDTAVVLRFIIEDRSVPSPSDIDQEFTLQPRTDPNRAASNGCVRFTSPPPLNGLDSSGLRPVGAMIVLVSPDRCSQATEYPGNCGVLGSLEILEKDQFSVRAHIEPVLMKRQVFLKGINHPTPLPQ